MHNSPIKAVSVRADICVNALAIANPLFEPVWDRRYVDYVTITVAEEVGVELRGGYYDGAGALRDMEQDRWWTRSRILRKTAIRSASLPSKADGCSKLQ